MDVALHDAAAATAAEPPYADRLFDLQLAFNLYPAWYAHPSWLAMLGDTTVLAEEYCELRTSPPWLRAMSTALLRGERLHQRFDADFFDPAKRLALVDATTLTRIAGLASATLLRERLRRVVVQSEVRAVHACMGAEAHEFAVRWSGSLPIIAPALVAGAWPLRDVWERISITQLFGALPSHAVGVIGRLRMKFPREWPAPKPRLIEPQRIGLTRFIIAVLLQSKTQWNWLFAPDFAVPHPSETHTGAQPC